MLAGESHGRVLLGNSMRADSQSMTRPQISPTSRSGSSLVLAELISWPSARPSAQGHLEVRAIKPYVVGAALSHTSAIAAAAWPACSPRSPPPPLRVE